MNEVVDKTAIQLRIEALVKDGVELKEGGT